MSNITTPENNPAPSNSETAETEAVVETTETPLTLSLTPVMVIEGHIDAVCEVFNSVFQSFEPMIPPAFKDYPLTASVDQSTHKLTVDNVLEVKRNKYSWNTNVLFFEEGQLWVRNSPKSKPQLSSHPFFQAMSICMWTLSQMTNCVASGQDVPTKNKADAKLLEQNSQLTAALTETKDALSDAMQLIKSQADETNALKAQVAALMQHLSPSLVQDPVSDSDDAPKAEAENVPPVKDEPVDQSEQSEVSKAATSAKSNTKTRTRRKTASKPKPRK